MTNFALRFISKNLNPTFYDSLALNHFAFIDNAIESDLYNGLTEYFSGLRAENSLKYAGIGSLSQFEVNRAVRGDKIYWLQRSDTEESVVRFYCEMELLIERLNREFFLSLSDMEFHFAAYPPGTFYRRHIDQFKGRNNRQLSVILYMNDEWKVGDGGELRVYSDEGHEDIAPLGNRLMIFKSDAIEHEVLETVKPRYSLTGWLLKNPVGLGFLG